MGADRRMERDLFRKREDTGSASLLFFEEEGIY